MTTWFSHQSKLTSNRLHFVRNKSCYCQQDFTVQVQSLIPGARMLMFALSTTTAASLGDLKHEALKKCKHLRSVTFKTLIAFGGKRMSNQSFGEMLREQRWDDHRYYHHSLINQSLHLVSACSFVIAYVYLLIDPVVSALIAWLISMTSRQAGHFFFEPKGYDYVNDATHEYKEAIKVGYNIRRKVVLMAIWAFAPVVLWFEPSLLGMIEPANGVKEWIRDVGQFWFMLGVGGLAFRVIQLGLRDGWKTGFVWATKIITDPFHDIKLYHRAPIELMRKGLEQRRKI